MTAAPVLAEVQRGGMVESRHRGHVVVVDDLGTIRWSLGDPLEVIYPRSAVKPLQAAGMLDAGLDIAGRDLALAAASHSGEPFHIAGVRGMLGQVGLSEHDLRCPPDRPYGEAAREAFLIAGEHPARVVMNCSGKHAAMLGTCVVNGWSTRDYLDPSHPLQQHLHHTIGVLAGCDPSPWTTDGCGAPLWGLPLVGLARALVRLPATSSGARVAAAMRDFPEYCGGTGRDVTELMRAVPGLVAKDGSESVQAMMVELDGRRFGIALKVEDGGQRARPVVAATVLAGLGVESDLLADQQREPVLGAGRPVGWLGPSATLVDASATGSADPPM